MAKWKDPRTPVSVHHLGRYKITIFDLKAYEQSKIDFPDDPNQADRPGRNDKPAFARKKPAARWNWIVPLGSPIGIGRRELKEQLGQTAV